ncbi:MAG: hypothetical protein EB023_15470, partial [Flavobacteriia bacterium]|nr:hypothetical protein [Flavobacteriia bacterium]
SGGGGGDGKSGGGSGGGEKTSKVSLKPMEVLEVAPVVPKSGGGGGPAEKTQLSSKQADSMLNSFSVKSNADNGMGLSTAGSSDPKEKADKGKKTPTPKEPTSTSIPGLDPLQKKSTQPGRLNVRFNY